MRILLVFKRMGIGGAETMIMNMLRYLKSNEYSFDFVVHSSQKGEFDDEIKNLGCNIYRCPEFSFKHLIKYVHWWRKHLKEHKYDIVHGNYRQSAPIYLQEAKRCGIGTIMHTHSASSRSRFSKLRRIPAKVIYKYSDYIFACSEKAAIWLFGEKILLDTKFKIIKNGIDMSAYTFNHSTREKYRKDLNIEDNYVVCHVGRFAPMKNHIFLIDIFSEIRKIIPDSILLLIGNGELKEDIENYVQKKNIKGVRFLGIRRDVPQLLQAADVFVLPSLFEGLPVSLLEAQAASLPCIFSDSITNEAVISSNAESLSLHESLELWAKKIISISKQETRCMRDYSNNSFNIQASVLEILNCYDTLHNN